MFYLKGERKVQKLIGIITLHSLKNPGSVLQSFALQKYLNNEGYENQIIDYRPLYSILGKNKINGLLRLILCYKNEKVWAEKYKQFIRENLILTSRKYKAKGALLSKTPQFDIYIAGSDQLWNLDYDCGNDESYYLKFVKTGHKISYATSVGKSNIPEAELQAICRNIENFEYLSVREESTSIVLTNYLSRSVDWVCDPVFLLDVCNYESLCSENIFGDYAVIYLSAGSELLEDVIMYVKSKYNCKIILAGGNIKRCSCDVHIKDLGPIDFLTLIKHAKIVISSSFHATAFSHIFHKNFVVILPPNNGERIISLLQISNALHKVIDNKEDIASAFCEVDFSVADKKLQEHISFSRMKLVKTIKVLMP